jgi:hypothetical protein
LWRRDIPADGGIVTAFGEIRITIGKFGRALDQDSLKHFGRNRTWFRQTGSENAKTRPQAGLKRGDGG